ncbi:FAD:protein FMN transferase [Lacinutrix neustonica]|uniref:FAD:protein FMN transferase n=1 Tax=Lacinutrix neustonica TaxID=2980107 RepID=A0A9E8MWC0_9FLAO|nr:FAD:protein FMN transferase [Lacinutrix neustonica]WAC01485.1 FAD:protein FMN transferase [Lacinutrix neustonica]
MKKFLMLLVLTVLVVSCKQTPKNTKLSGSVFGTFYDITYYSEASKNYTKQIDSLLYIINKSMSNYQTNSDISKVNRHELDVVDAHFEKVFIASKQIYNETDGVFDPTIGKLVNAWNFGSEKNRTKLDSIKVDSLMQFVGFDKMMLKNNTLTKMAPKSYIDFNAIAKGYAVDVIAEFLEQNKSRNYMVNIGGELRTKGINMEKQLGWTVGIENPNFDGSQSYDKVFVLKDQAMATSGTYRKFKLDANGNRYAHIINTKTGYPTKTNILSVSVIAKNCMLADGYATAFQAMGIDEVKHFLESHRALKAYVIFENDQQEFETLALNNFPEN